MDWSILSAAAARVKRDALKTKVEEKATQLRAASVLLRARALALRGQAEREGAYAETMRDILRVEESLAECMRALAACDAADLAMARHQDRCDEIRACIHDAESLPDAERAAVIDAMKREARRLRREGDGIVETEPAGPCRVRHRSPRARARRAARRRAARGSPPDPEPPSPCSSSRGWLS